MPGMGAAKPCPNNCGRTQAPGMFLCRRCWFALPLRLRTDVWRTFRANGAYSREAAAARAAALDWLRTRG